MNTNRFKSKILKLKFFLKNISLFLETLFLYRVFNRSEIWRFYIAIYAILDGSRTHLRTQNSNFCRSTKNHKYSQYSPFGGYHDFLNRNCYSKFENFKTLFSLIDRSFCRHHYKGLGISKENCKILHLNLIIESCKHDIVSCESIRA